MKLNKSEIFKYVHNILKHKNVAYYGGYHKAFGHFLREVNEQGLVWGWNV